MRAFLTLLLLALAACSSGGSTPTPPAGKWTFQYSPGMPANPSPQAGAVWTFNFPNYDGPFPCASDQACPGAHYLVTPGSLKGKTSITVAGQISGTGTLDNRTQPNACPSASYMRLYIERAGDDLTQDFYRWWSNPQGVNLDARGSFSMSVSLTDPAQWTSVNGHNDAGGLSAARDSSMAYGMTFGGCFFGHGVNAHGGPVSLTLTQFAIK